MTSPELARVGGWAPLAQPNRAPNDPLQNGEFRNE